MKLNILVLYDPCSTFTKTVREHLESFKIYSRHNICYAVGARGAECKYDLNIFDVIIVHYSLRFIREFGDNILTSSYRKQFAIHKGHKVLFLQDEYDNTNMIKKWIKTLGFNTVFTCVPEQYVKQVYLSEFPNTEFITSLTGFAPDPGLYDYYVKPSEERKLSIAYRGRKLPYRYGNLGQEKYQIGFCMARLCKQRNLPVDIEVDDSKRIYGDNWYHFLANSRATLGTESGSNIFDFTGEIAKNIERALQAKPDISYQEVFERYLSEYENKIKMNQISPKIFESISLRTALILFEGVYSGVIQPHVHYIPLKKDFSNVDEVLKKVQDDNYLKSLTERAYHDIILSGKFSYRMFIRQVDDLLSQRVKISDPIEFIAINIAYRRNTNKNNCRINLKALTNVFSPQVFNFIEDAHGEPLPSSPANKKTLLLFRKKSPSLVVRKVFYSKLTILFLKYGRPFGVKALHWLDKWLPPLAALLRFTYNKLCN